MNILKPQKAFFNNLQNEKLDTAIKNDKIEKMYFECEEKSEIELYDIEFDYCKFYKISILNSKMEKATFKDVIFNNCNFSNTSFMNSAFIRCEFNNCKLEGANLADSILHNVAFIGTNAKYINLSLASIEKVLFEETTLRHCYFQENKLKNVYFKKVDLSQAQFFKTSLKDVDLSNSNIEEIVISIEDIKGATIDQMQALDLLYLLGVKIK